jgi:hypothetical protein
MRYLLYFATAGMLAACGHVEQGHGGDGGVIEPPPQLPATPSREIVVGASQLHSASYTLDVEIGHPVSQGSTASATYKLEGNSAIKP